MDATTLPTHERFSRELIWTTTATSFSFVVVQLDVTIVNVALPAIAGSLRAGVAALQWVVDAYTLVFAVLLLTAGTLGERWGQKRVYQAGFVVFALASALCGLAPDAVVLIAARAAQGVGAALLLPNSLALLSHATAHHQGLRARAVGLWTAAGAISIAAGPIAGSLLVEGLGWRSIFLVNLPLAALGVWLTRRHVEDSERSPGRGLDPAGQVLAVLSLTALTAAAIEAQPLGLTHPLVLGGLLLAPLAAAGFVAVEARAGAPMLPLGLFRRPNFSAAVVFGVLVNLSYYGVIFVLSLYLQRAHGWSALRTGLAYLPLTGGFFFSNVAAGPVVARFGSRLPMTFGAAVGALGYLLLVRLDAQSSYWAMLPAFFLIPAGMGLAVPAMTAAMLASVEKRWSGTASAVLNAARQAGGAVGVALFGALVNGGAERIVSGLGWAAAVSVGLLVVGAGVAWWGIGRR